MSPSKRLSAPGLHALIRRLLMAAATPRHIADVVAEVLVNSNLAGHDSHGVLHLPRYLKSIADAQLDAAAEPAVVRETAASLVIDGRDGHGHYAARWGMRRLLEKAAENEICRASFRRIQHMGRLGEYAEMAAREGFIGIVLYGGSGSCTLPYGGAEGALGTNPIAAGIPTAGGPPLRSRLRHQRDRHQQGPARPQPRPAPAFRLHRRPGRESKRRPGSLLRRRKPARLRRPQGIRPVAARGAAVRAVGGPRGGRRAHRRPTSCW